MWQSLTTTTDYKPTTPSCQLLVIRSAGELNNFYVCFEAANQQRLKQRLLQEAENLTRWSQKNNLLLNISKTQDKLGQTKTKIKKLLKTQFHNEPKVFLHFRQNLSFTLQLTWDTAEHVTQITVESSEMFIKLLNCQQFVIVIVYSSCSLTMTP